MEHRCDKCDAALLPGELSHTVGVEVVVSLAVLKLPLPGRELVVLDV
jgi:hypothetical protein